MFLLGGKKIPQLGQREMSAEVRLIDPANLRMAVEHEVHQGRTAALAARYQNRVGHAESGISPTMAPRSMRKPRLISYHSARVSVDAASRPTDRGMPGRQLVSKRWLTNTLRGPIRLMGGLLVIRQVCHKRSQSGTRP